MEVTMAIPMNTQLPENIDPITIGLNPEIFQEIFPVLKIRCYLNITILYRNMVV